MIRLSRHTQQRIAERAIAIAWLEATIADADWTAPDADPTLTQSFKAIEAFGNRILKVVHRPDGADILVVTAYFDRSANHDAHDVRP